MNRTNNPKYIYETTIPYLDFNYRKHSNKATIIGYVFAQEIEKIDRFLFFIRAIYHVFEPSKDTVVNGFLDQTAELSLTSSNDDTDWELHFQEIFSWEEQEKVIAKLIFTQITNLYLNYITDMASYVIDKEQLQIDKKNALRSYPKIKRCFRMDLETPLHITDEEERLADQIVTLRNLVVHSLDYIPDKYYPKFHDWKNLGCIKQDSDIFHIEFDYKSLEKFGDFLSKAIADIDNRLSENHDLPSYFFDEEDVPDDYVAYTDKIDHESFDVMD